jgi:DNA-directed RNA polymerase specialized sigma24 family protein
LKKLQIAVACLALAGVALAQANSSGPKLEKRQAAPAKSQGTASNPAAATAPSETSSVAPDAAVVTVEGLCEKPGGSNATPADCKTVITRAEFEKIVNAVQPNMPTPAKKQFVNRYVAALFLAEKAHELGLDQGPTFDERMHIARLQVLAQMGGERMHQEVANVTEGEIEIYYHDHIADYKTISYDHLLVPKQKQVDPATEKPGDPDLQKKREASEAEMKAEADKLRARAAAGEDFAKLQQEAYDFGGYTQVKASTNPRVDKARKDRIPVADASIFELKAGDVSQVFANPGGYAVYKIEAIEDVPLASVHDEISRKLAAEREHRQIDSWESSTKLDDAYFAAPATPAPPTLRNPGEAAPAPAPAPGKN